MILSLPSCQITLAHLGGSFPIEISYLVIMETIVNLLIIFNRLLGHKRPLFVRFQTLPFASCNRCDGAKDRYEYHGVKLIVSNFDEPPLQACHDGQ